MWKKLWKTAYHKFSELKVASSIDLFVQTNSLKPQNPSFIITNDNW